MNRVGLDDPDRDRNAELSRKYGNALIGSLRRSEARHDVQLHRCDALR